MLASLLTLGSAGVPAGADGANLVVNPDFESALPDQGQLGWSTWQKLDGAVFRTVSDPGFARSGTKCVSIEQTVKNQHNYAVWMQLIPAKARTTYRYSFWIRTQDVRPTAPFTGDRPVSCGNVGFLNSDRKDLTPGSPFIQSNSVLMTHDWKKFELSFTTPEDTAYIKINLAVGNAVGTVYFDSVSLVASSFKKIPSPGWLSDAVIYAAGPWEFQQFGNGRAYTGIMRKLPELEALGVNVLYVLPIWEDAGWYRITDHFALFRNYGTEQELRTLVDEAHRHRMKVLLDLAGTIGVPLESRLVREHPGWFILNIDGTLYRSWGDLFGLDTNLSEVQQYFADFARYYVERFDVDGYRCDAAIASPYEMFEGIRRAIQQIKPDTALIAEESAPFDHETAFDVTYDFTFRELVSLFLSNPHDVAKTIRRLSAQRDSLPPGALQLRQLESQDVDHTVSSKCSFAGATAFATLLFTMDGIPMIYNGQEVGNREPQVGWWKPAINWDANPDAARYREAYTKLAQLRARYPALRQGSLDPINSSDDRVAAAARILPGLQAIITVISFSPTTCETRLDLPAKALRVSKSFFLSDLLDDSRFTVSNPTSFALTLQPYQPRILLVVPNE